MVAADTGGCHGNLCLAFLIGTVVMWISDLVFEVIVRQVKEDVPPT